MTLTRPTPHILFPNLPHLLLYTYSLLLLAFINIIYEPVVVFQAKQLRDFTAHLINLI